MGVVNETIEDGVGVGGIADDFVPAVDGKLGSDHRGAAAVALFEDFQEIVPGGGVERLQPPIVEDEQVDAAEIAQQPRMAAIAARQREFLEQPRHALVEDGSIVPACLMAERGGQPTFADAGRADQRQIVVSVDPLALDQLLEQGAVETAGTAIVDILDAGLLAQFGDAQPSPRGACPAAMRLSRSSRSPSHS